MRKKLSLIAASAAAAVGLGLAIASPASAATTHGYYSSPEACAAELAKLEKQGVQLLHCEKTIGNSVPGEWVLLSGMAG
ncbi:hypothetical protein ACWD4G_26395 [Streptomyces sp. NPDC002643]